LGSWAPENHDRAALADELGWSFFDLDDDIEAAAGSKSLTFSSAMAKPGSGAGNQALDRRVAGQARNADDRG
jgi:hypothetical protein